MVTDTSPDGAYFGSFTIGADVQIFADAALSGGEGLPAFIDPDFETELRAVTINATASRSSRRVETGTMAALISPTKSTAPWQVQLPPGPLQAPGTNPDAWDGLPQLGPGQTWELQLRVWLPELVRVTVRPLVYSGPWATAVRVVSLELYAEGPAGGGWVTIGAPAQVVPGQTTGWLGVQIEGYGGGSWDNQPAAQLWDEVPPDVTWADYGDAYIDRVTILAPATGTISSLLVFQGRITDLEAGWGASSPQLSVTATDFLGDLGNRYVGDEPWLAEPLSTRFLRVLQLATATGEQPHHRRHRPHPGAGGDDLGRRRPPGGIRAAHRYGQLG